MALVNQKTGDIIAPKVILCDTFLKRGRGLMFRQTLPPDEVYIFVEGRESVALTSIHMLFVFFPIAVLWLNNERQVVDTVLAQPFRPHYAPSQSARYFVEGVPALLEKVSVGDFLDWDS